MPAWIVPPYNTWSDVDDFVTPDNTTWGQVKGLGLTWRDVPVRVPPSGIFEENWRSIKGLYVNNPLDEWRPPAGGIWLKEAGGWTPVLF